ncbi:MAG: polysaccharide deacetylase family protein [Desulfovibrionaceae bacterium]|nr:polysaccharide deacetylase family protein [Desulfovibrionaceae bacterium]
MPCGRAGAPREGHLGRFFAPACLVGAHKRIGARMLFMHSCLHAGGAQYFVLYGSCMVKKYFLCAFLALFYCMPVQPSASPLLKQAVSSFIAEQSQPLVTALPTPPDLFQALWPHGLPPLRASDMGFGVPNNTHPSLFTVPRHASTVLHKLLASSNAAAGKPLPYGTIRRVALPPGRKAVALTFDLCELQCSVAGYEQGIISALLRYKAHATFFMSGKWMRSHEERALQLMAARGFEVGNHAWTHANFAIINKQKADEQIEWTQAWYEHLREKLGRMAEAAGYASMMDNVPYSMTLFRLPYGRCTPASLTWLQEHGLHVVQWDVVAEGMHGESVAQAMHAMLEQVRPGSIILFHANSVPEHSLELLLFLLDYLDKKGWECQTVSELMAAGKPEYSPEGYFRTPGDNASIDGSFGQYGTGE